MYVYIELQVLLVYHYTLRNIHIVDDLHGIFLFEECLGT